MLPAESSLSRCSASEKKGHGLLRPPSNGSSSSALVEAPKGQRTRPLCDINRAGPFLTKKKWLGAKGKENERRLLSCGPSGLGNRFSELAISSQEISRAKIDQLG